MQPIARKLAGDNLGNQCKMEPKRIVRLGHALARNSLARELRLPPSFRALILEKMARQTLSLRFGSISILQMAPNSFVLQIPGAKRFGSISILQIPGAPNSLVIRSGR